MPELNLNIPQFFCDLRAEFAYDLQRGAWRVHPRLRVCLI